MATTILFIPLILYILQSEKWRRVWRDTEEEDNRRPEATTLISVLIPFRNESRALPHLLKSLSLQSYTHWELILVNDHSDDDGERLLRSQIPGFPVNITILQNQGKGKKQALATGARQARGPLLVSSDCDCTFERDWLASLAAFFEREDPDLIIAPVRQIDAGSWTSDFQVSEFMALQLSGGSSALMNRAIMLNGANLACKKEVYLQSRLQSHIASGDDMFLLEYLKQQKGKVSYLKSGSAMVYTPTEPGARALLKQKARWAGKARHYKDHNIIISGLIVASTNIIQLALLLTGFYHSLFFNLFALYYLVRLMVDYRLLRAGSTFFSYWPCVRRMVIYQLLYPAYVIAVMIYPLFYPLEWKGRMIRP